MDLATQRKWDAASRTLDFFYLCRRPPSWAAQAQTLRKVARRDPVGGSWDGQRLQILSARHAHCGHRHQPKDDRTSRGESRRVSGNHRAATNGCLRSRVSGCSVRHDCHGVHLLLRAEARGRSSRASSRTEAGRPAPDVQARAQWNRATRCTDGFDDADNRPIRPGPQSGYRRQRSEDGVSSIRVENVYLDVVKAIEAAK